MKKGKRELELTPVQARHKRERAMLRTYFISLLSLVLCCAMFFGTTMAWFTSDVTSGKNVITAGTLSAKLSHVVSSTGSTDVQLLGAETPIYIDLEDPENAEHQPFGSAPLAPTYSTEATFCVENTGNLPFRYQVYLNMEVEEEALSAFVGEGAPVGVSPEDLAGCFNVYVNDSTTSIGTLKELMTINDGDRKVVFEGEVYPESVIRDDNALKSSEMFTIRIELDKDATAEIMSMKLTFNIQLVANQLVAESSASAEVQPQS